MKTIGLVTFWDNNYGSALQCYALKKIITSFGYRCNLLEERHTSKSVRFIHLIKKPIYILFKSVRYPQFLKAYIELRHHAHVANNALSEKSCKYIHFFGITELQPKELSRKALKKLGKDERYIAFITGSDQVWGGHFVEPTYGNFLEFAPKLKRISYAASFGSEFVANYNLSKYRSGINGIDRVSVREESGKKIVKELTGKSAVIMPDPTILVSVNEWKKFSENIVCESDPFVLVHFLDRMSENAVSIVKLIAKEMKLKIVCVGWKREEILSVKNSNFIDGGPREYIALISKATYICTDSFHTTLFALRFKKQFYTFPRCYSHRFHQTGRITNLLKNVGYLNRYIINKINYLHELPVSEIDCSHYFELQRDLGIEYLKDSISNLYDEIVPRPNLKEEDECCGCGVCTEKCPQHAIHMIYTEKGYSVPVIDEKMCVSCCICEKYCRKQIHYSNGKKEAYIAYSKDEILLKHSASGGVFSSIAKQFIMQGGFVYGARMRHNADEMYVEHCCASNMNQLYPLLQSKYVQSNAVVCFKEISDRLIKNQLVLFSGTSCQIDALYRYLGKKYDNLYTIDLICHGVPGEKFFSDYVKYLEDKYGDSVVSFSFRKKKEGKIEYCQCVKYQSGQVRKTSVEKSDYYKLFFSEDSYRENCYNCNYASIYKPADITVGDYFECEKDYPQLFEEGEILTDVNGISCLICHNKKGEELLSIYGNDLNLIPADMGKIQSSHNNLCFPSQYTDMREKIMGLYKKGGFKKVHRYNRYIDCMYFIPRLTKKLLKRVL